MTKRLPDMQRGMTLGALTPSVYLSCSAAWAIAAAVVVVFFLFFIGPGLK